MEWIRAQRFGSEAQRRAPTHDSDEVARLGASIDRLSEDIERIAGELSGLHSVMYRSLQALRGVRTLVAATLVCEIGDLRRLAKPSRPMSYVGLVPSEHSSGSRVFPHVRRVLLEAAWAGRLGPVRLQRRHEGVDPKVIDISWKAQKRLHARYVRLRARGKEQNVTIIALARELLGFVWAIGQAVEPKTV